MDWTPLIQVVQNVLSIDVGTLIFVGIAFAAVAWLISKGKELIQGKKEK